MRKYTILEVAELLGVARKVVDAMIRTGELESVKIGTRHFVLPRQLDAYLTSIGVDRTVDGDEDATEIDAAGELWNPLVHSATRAKTAIGYWRKKRTVKNMDVDVTKAVNKQLQQSECKPMTLREEEIVTALMAVLGH